MALRGQHFDTFREFLEICNDPKNKGTYAEEFLYIIDSQKVLTIDEALTTLPPEELESSGGFNAEPGHPVFLDIHEGAQGRECRYIIKWRSMLDSEANLKRRQEEWPAKIKEQYPSAGYYIVEFKQASPFSESLSATAVMNNAPYPFTPEGLERAEKAAKYDESRMRKVREFSNIFEVRLAENYQKAKEGIFLDESYPVF